MARMNKSASLDLLNIEEFSNNKIFILVLDAGMFMNDYICHCE